MLKSVLIISWLCLSATLSHAIIVKEIHYKGLKQTSPEYLQSITYHKLGVHYNDSIWKNDIQLIKNTNLFFEVTWTMREVDNYLILTVELNESTYIVPIFDINAISSNFKLQMGANNINWLGRNYTLGGFYQYYQRHSFKIYNIAPRHLNRKTGHEIILGSYATIEPLYFDSTKSDFNYDNYSISVGGFYWLDDFNRFSLGGMLMQEHYENIEMRVGDYDIGFTLDMFKYQLRGFFEHKRVNLHHQYFDGLYYQLFLENIETKDYPEASFFKVMARLKYYKRLGKHGNLASNIDVGFATNNDSPFSPFVLDSYLNVRGIGNRVARGTAQIIGNLEYRHTIWTNKLFYLQTNVFTDFGCLRPPGQSFTEMFESSNYALYSGLGLRIHTRKIYNTVFRFDYGFNTAYFSQSGFVFGVNQFF